MGYPKTAEKPASSYLKCDRLHLLRFSGSTLDRARQHGEFMKQILADSTDPLALETLAHKNQIIIERALRTKLLNPIYENLILKLLVPRLPKDLRDLVETAVSSSGIEKREAWLALYQPDMMMVLAAISTERYRNLFLEGMPGCSTAMLTKTSHHESYFSRNLDYPAASAWERWPAVFYHEPDHAQRFFHVASLGIHTAGLTGVNESGIAFALHAHFSKKISLGGVPIFFAGERLLEQAKNLSEAIDVLKKFKPMGSWAFNLASFSENKAVSVELAEGKVLIRDTDAKGALSHSNGFQHAELQDNQLHFTGAVVEDLSCRKSSLESYIQKRQPNYTLEDSLKVLANHTDLKTGALRVYGNTVSVVTTIQSVIFEPHTESMYVSTRAETPTDLGPYVKLPFSWDKITEAHFLQKPIEVNHGLSENFLRALHEYHLAYVAWHVKHLDEMATLPHLRAAVDFAPTDPHLYIQKGYFELRTGKYEAAKDSYTEALKHLLSPNLQHVATYFLAASLDLCGARDQAVSHYRSLDEGKVAPETPVDPKIKRRVKKHLKRAWKSSDCQKIQPDLQFVEPIDYP